MYLGIEIGGTKLQLGVGPGTGPILGLWRGTVDQAEGAEGIRRQIVAAVPELLAGANINRKALLGIGIGFGGPTDDATQTVIESHQVAGWNNFPLTAWVSEQLGNLPAILCNDADTAGLGESLFGAGRGLSPVFYITVGTGVGGGLIVGGKIYRGLGRGAAEIGHLRVGPYGETVESYSAGPGIARRARELVAHELAPGALHRLVGGDGARITAKLVAEAARAGDPAAIASLEESVKALAEGILNVIALLCPRRVVVGGGVSLIGEDLFFGPLRAHVARRVFASFAGLTDIVPAALGEEVVIHGALALARQKFGG